ncbi:hypothetical protein [Clostridium estertheticum]|uniref:hypothetical protein n=1 Tax=Clostridium estertheticum TaxID=238834 RepID=UPI001C7DE231|nr:hypothetical protein [Clostridium estertheticum]MBX4266527.1 hypothetical protein [Clostridium estertheticum]WLC88133.1 hypothetical protein KTC95_19260 [Clostridium estertheticum]
MLKYIYMLIVEIKVAIATSLTNIAMVKADTTTIKNDTALIKEGVVAGATYGDNLATQTTDIPATTIAALSGKYELTGYSSGGNALMAIRIDGATNRKLINTGTGTVNLTGMGIKCNSSMVISTNGANVTVTYRLLP